MLDKRFVSKSLTGILMAASLVLSLSACGFVEQERIISYPDYKQYTSAKEAVRDADIIVVGKVHTVHPPREWNINLNKSAEPVNEVYTLSDIEVIHTVKGPPPGASITIKQAGGSYEGVIYEEEGMQFVEAGRTYLLFLDSFDDRAPGEPYTLINPAQGMLEVNNDVIATQGKAAYIQNGTPVAQIVQELRGINEALPPKRTNVDKDLIDKYLNKPD